MQSNTYIDDRDSHEREQSFALIIVLLGYTHSALAVLGYVLLIASLHHSMSWLAQSAANKADLSMTAETSRQPGVTFLAALRDDFDILGSCPHAAAGL